MPRDTRGRKPVDRRITHCPPEDQPLQRLQPQLSSTRAGSRSRDIGTMLQNQHELNTSANRFARVVARFLDSMIVVTITVLLLRHVSFAIDFLASVSPAVLEERLIPRYTFPLSLVLVGALYEFITTSSRGFTLGKAIVGLKVVQYDLKEILTVRQTAQRTRRQSLLYVLFPLGLVSAGRLMAKPDSSRWYDRGLGVHVVWAVGTRSLRRRPWIWAEQHTQQSGTLYSYAIVWLLMIYFVVALLDPLEMTERQATIVVQALIGINSTTLAAYAGSGALSKYSRNERVSEDARNLLAVVAFAPSLLSIFGIVAGVEYLSSVVESEPLSWQRQVFRTGTVALSVSSLVSLLILLLMNAGNDRTPKDRHPTELQDQTNEHRHLHTDGRTSLEPSSRTTVSNRTCQGRHMPMMARLMPMALAFLGGLVSVLLLWVHDLKRKKN